MDMITYVIGNYKGKAKIATNKHNKKIISSYKYQLVRTTTLLDLIITFFWSLYLKGKPTLKFYKVQEG